MKRFLIGFLGSTLLMFGVVYMSVISPNLSTNVLTSDEEIFGDGQENVAPTSEEVSEEIFGDGQENLYQERISKGDTLFEGGYYPLAAVEYQFAINVEPNYDTPYVRLAQANFLDEKYGKSVEALKTAIKIDPLNQEAQILLGESYLELEQFKNARNHFSNLTFEDTRGLYYKGVLAAYFGDHESAEWNFNKVIERADRNDLSQHSSNFLASMREFALAEDASPHYLKTLIGRSLSETGESNLAISLLYDVLRDEPEYRDAWIILGYSYLSEEKYSEAQDALFKAVEMDPTKAESRYFLGLSYFGMDDYNSSMTQLELAIESGFEPKVQAYQKLGDVAVLAKSYKKAADSYEKVLILNSEDIELFIRPVWLNIDHLNDAKKALVLGEQAVKEHPSEAMSYNLLGWAQLSLNDLKGAEQNLKYSLIIDPNLAAAHFNLGRLYEARTQLDEARDSFKEAYTIDPGGSIGNLAAERYNVLVTTPTTP
jgi:tetratricopeptide (TPR) repeat protein